jgi:hypothetical protein
MKFKLIDLTPKTKFYVVNNGDIVAARFTKAELELKSQFNFEGYRPLDCTLVGRLQLANGETLGVKFTYRICSGTLTSSTDKIYTTADDAREQHNSVEFELSQYEFLMLMNKFGLTPTPYDYRGVRKDKYYSLWYFDRDSNHFGAHLTPIKKVDIFSGDIVTDKTPSQNELFNTKEECEKSNQVEVVEFDDEPTEDEPCETDDMGVHIVFVSIVK